MGVFCMYENLGVAFSKIRDEKKISVKDIVRNNKLSESQYYRFVKQESDIGLTKFLNLLENLNVQLEEFIYLLPESKNDLQHSKKQSISPLRLFKYLIYSHIEKTYSFVSPLTD